MHARVDVWISALLCMYVHKTGFHRCFGRTSRAYLAGSVQTVFPGKTLQRWMEESVTKFLFLVMDVEHNILLALISFLLFFLDWLCLSLCFSCLATFKRFWISFNNLVLPYRIILYRSTAIKKLQKTKLAVVPFFSFFSSFLFFCTDIPVLFHQGFVSLNTFQNPLHHRKPLFLKEIQQKETWKL